MSGPDIPVPSPHSGPETGPGCVAPGARDAVEALRAALSRGDEDWAYAVALEVRDRLRDRLRDQLGEQLGPQPGDQPGHQVGEAQHHAHLAAAWATCPDGLDARWHALLAAFVSHEFESAGLPAPGWTTSPRLGTPWVLDTPRLTESQIRAQTPAWLAARNIYIATKDLGTL